MAHADQVYFFREAIERQFGFANSVRAGNTLYLSGLVSVDMQGNVLDADNMEAQMRNVYGELKGTLAMHGLSFEHVVKETIYTTDLDALVANIPVRHEFYRNVAPPASTWVEVRKLAFPGIVLEVELTLYIP